MRIAVRGDLMILFPYFRRQLRMLLSDLPRDEKRGIDAIVRKLL